MALASLWFFLLLGSFYLLRPLRETFGISRGAGRLPWLMMGTLAAMALANPVYAWAASRWPRRVFAPSTYRVLLGMLLLFWGAWRLGLPGLGPCFYAWISVFNLFIVAVFWSVLADLFDEGQGRRFFGLVSLGGTLGAMAGAAVTERLVGHFGVEPSHLLLLAALVLETATQVLRMLGRRTDWKGRGAGREPGARISEGLRLLRTSRYLQAMALFMVLYTLLSTVLYLLQGRIVEGAFAGAAARTAAFARLDVGANALTLGCQVFLTPWILRRHGPGLGLAVLPAVLIAGFLALALHPAFATLAVVIILERGLHYGLDRPSREVLYIPLGPEEKYKSKAFIDTFVYRAGDVVGVWLPAGLGLVGIGAAPAAGVLAVGWLACAGWLGRLRAGLKGQAEVTPGEG